jgi:hypothetical protein
MSWTATSQYPVSVRAWGISSDMFLRTSGATENRLAGFAKNNAAQLVDIFRFALAHFARIASGI